MDRLKQLFDKVAANPALLVSLIFGAEEMAHALLGFVEIVRPPWDRVLAVSLGAVVAGAGAFRRNYLREEHKRSEQLAKATEGK